MGDGMMDYSDEAVSQKGGGTFKAGARQDKTVWNCI